VNVLFSCRARVRFRAEHPEEVDTVAAELHVAIEELAEETKRQHRETDVIRIPTALHLP